MVTRAGVLAVLTVLVARGHAEAVVAGGWRPSLGVGLGLGLDSHKSSTPYLAPHFQNPTASDEQCALYKVAFTQDLYFQYVQYKVNVPDLLQFTLCTWQRFTNHSNDHPLFSYAVPDQPRAIYSWVSNSARSSYLSLSVAGHTFYRLNYPFRLHRWYHSCQSWNGKTGEWQAWVNAERVGRGFHNRLVGNIVPGGGIAITGQEQRQYGGGFLEGPGSPKGSGGLLGEVTLLHLYAAALAPGKAHKDHKHHHGNHHEQNPTNGQRPSTPPPPPLPVNQFQSPFLVSGQLLPRVPNVGAQLAGVTRAPGSPVPALLPAQLFPSQVDLAQLSVDPTAFGLQHKLFKRNMGENNNGDEHDDVTGRKAKRELLGDPNALPQGLDGFLGADNNPLSIPEDLLFSQKPKNEPYPREPAEGEVEQIMAVCSGCAREPFKKVEIISWRATPKKLYSGALFMPATPECRKF